jgi:MoxR-like ATPase
VGYPDPEAEVELLARRLARDRDEVELSAIVDRDELIAMQQAVERVHVNDSVTRYIVAIAAATRSSPQIQVGASPRGTLALLSLARARAAIDGRDFVVPDDVKSVAVPALAHRIALRPELWVKQIAAVDVIGECLASVATPVVERGAPARA